MTHYDYILELVLPLQGGCFSLYFSDRIIAREAGQAALRGRPGAASFSITRASDGVVLENVVAPPRVPA